MSNENDKGVKPIWEKFLQPNYLFALEFKEGWIFARVIRRRICHFKPWNLIDADGNAVDIAASSHEGEYRFRDPRGPSNDILYLDSTINSGYPWILHGSIGIRPEQVMMYPKFPEAKTIPGKFPNLDPIRPESGAGGDEYMGYVTSSQSPYEQPTDYYEYVIPPGIHMGANYWNSDGSRSHQPALHLLFAVYWFEVLNTKDPRLTAKIANRRVMSSFLTVGFGDDPERLGQRLKDEWEVNPLSLAEAAGGF